MTWPFTALVKILRGVHPDPRKQALIGQPVETLRPTPTEVRLPLRQHAGGAARLVAAPRAQLQPGDLVAEAPAGIGARIHSPIAGRLVSVTAVTLPDGHRTTAIRIKGDVTDPLTWDAWTAGRWDVPPEIEPPEIRRRIAAAGVVGLGGAAFPTHLKLNPDPARPIDTLLVNGCECEPYLAADARLMIEAPQLVRAGVELARLALGGPRTVIAIEDDKPAAIEAMEAAAATTELGLAVCRTTYPMGGERQLVPAVVGREVPTGGYPLDVGVVVLNVATAAAIAQAVLRERPLTHRLLTVAGPGVVRPATLFAPIGTPLALLLAACGGMTETACRVLAGGPMMGHAVTDLSVPMTKATGGLVVLDHATVDRTPMTACIRCGRCVDVCPLGLMPTRIARAAAAGMLERALDHDLLACCECGCCAYACPARLPLVQEIRAGKAAARRLRRPRT